jgi:hypothetical protein
MPFLRIEEIPCPIYDDTNVQHNNVWGYYRIISSIKINNTIVYIKDYVKVHKETNQAEYVHCTGEYYLNIQSNVPTIFPPIPVLCNIYEIEDLI